MARVVGVRVDAEASVDDPLLAEAEAGARAAASWFATGLVATAACVAGMFLWSPVQMALMEPFMHFGYHAVVEDALSIGLSWSIALACAGVTQILLGLAAGLLNAAVFGGIPMYLLRRSTLAAAPAVSVALARRLGAVDDARLSAYPRVACGVERILGPRRALKL